MLLLLTTDKNALLLAKDDTGGAGYLLQHGHNKISACQVVLQAPPLPSSVRSSLPLTAVMGPSGAGKTT